LKNQRLQSGEDLKIVGSFTNLSKPGATVFVDDTSLLIALWRFLRMKIYSPAWLSVTPTKPRRHRYYRVLSNYLGKLLAAVGK
jgi:hypothetical protein